MNRSSKDQVINKLTKHKKKGLVVVLLCVLACELPLLIALLGLGGLSFTVYIAPITAMLRTLGLTISILGVLAIFGYLSYRIYTKVME